MAELELSQVIESLREELEKAAAAGKGKAIRFEVGEVTLETEVAITAKADGKVGFAIPWFTSAEASTGIERARTQKISIQLTPKGSVLLSRAGGDAAAWENDAG